MISIESLSSSANKGSDDAYDVSTSLTGYEPNYMAISELSDSQGSFFYITPSSDQDLDDATLGKLLTEAHRGQADYCDPEGVSVSQSSLSVVFDRSGKPVGESSSNAQIRTLFDEKRQMIIAECCEKVSHHELQAARAEQERQILHEELWRQQKDFREVHQQLRWRSYENSRVLPSIRSPHRSSSRIRTLFGIIRKITRIAK